MASTCFTQSFGPVSASVGDCPKIDLAEHVLESVLSALDLVHLLACLYSHTYDLEQSRYSMWLSHTWAKGKFGIESGLTTPLHGP